MLLFQVHKEKNYTSPDGSLSYEELERQLLDVFSQAEHAFKINFACGIILRNVTDGTYLYLHPMESDPVLKGANANHEQGGYCSTGGHNKMYGPN